MIYESLRLLKISFYDFLINFLLDIDIYLYFLFWLINYNYN